VGFVLLSRPLFLAGGFLLFALGVTIAFYQGSALHPAAYLWGQVLVTSTQLMTHYTNEYFDYAADVANQTPTPWSGGSRALPEGRITPGVARAAGLISGLVALVALLMLVIEVGSGPFIIPLAGFSLLLAWGYSAPPLQFHSRGVGELVVAILVPGLTVLVGYYLQAGRWDWLPFLAILPLCGFQFSMILGVQYPDLEGDRIANKRNLTVRYGRTWTARLHLVVITGVFVALPLLVWWGLPGRVAGLVALFAAPIAVWLGWQLARGRYADPAWWSWIAFFGIGLLMIAVLAEWVAFLSLL
jgi:1,4-dihydroxy-2-naphthoate octaprenyltransferase